MIVSRSSRGRQSGPSFQISLVAQAEYAAQILPAYRTELSLRAMYYKLSRDSGLNGVMPRSPFVFV